MIYIALAVLVLWAFLRSVSFGVYQVRVKNYSGAIAVFILTVFAVVSSILNLLT